ncbi:MAG: FAD-binding protein [Alphaproteobacteria bacterium]
MTETLLVAGAGIAGLNAALALARPGREVIVLDRDPPPPDLDPDTAFYEWERKGVTQLRHSHVFLGRLVKLIRDNHPRLWTELLASGAREFTFADALPPGLQKSYVAAPGDEDMSFLFSRRSTLELIMRRYAQTLPGVRFVPNVGIRGIVAERRGETVAVTGLKTTVDDTETVFSGDAVIDATGRDTQFPDWLAAHGVTVEQPPEPAGILYFTRHYRLRDGMDEPPRDGTPGAGDLGYIKFGVFVADNRHFSVTLAVPEIESELRTAVMKPETFDAVCAAIPGAFRWTDPARAEGVTKVFGMGNLKSMWRRYTGAGQPAIVGFFPIGDAALRTNPLYGRGCSIGAIHAHMLAGVLADIADPAARLAELEKRNLAAIRPYFDVMVKQDAQAIRRAANEQIPGYQPRFKARVVKSLLEDAIGPASRGDLAMMRAMMRAFHMLDDPTAWIRKPATIWKILRTWATPKRLKAHLYEPSFGPQRAEMLRRLGLAA